MSFPCTIWFDCMHILSSMSSSCWQVLLECKLYAWDCYVRNTSSEFLLVIMFNYSNTVVAKWCLTPLIPTPAIGHNNVLFPTASCPTIYHPKIHFNVISFYVLLVHILKVFSPPECCMHSSSLPLHYCLLHSYLLTTLSGLHKLQSTVCNIINYSLISSFLYPNVFQIN